MPGMRVTDRGGLISRWTLTRFDAGLHTSGSSTGRRRSMISATNGRPYPLRPQAGRYRPLAQFAQVYSVESLQKI
jgi:hypothetical protein